MWRSLLTHPWSIFALALLAVLITLPTLNVGLIGDDFLIREVLIGQDHREHAGTFFDLFTFADGQAAHAQLRKASGMYPWWVADSVRMSFWRPLSELTHWLDYQLWPNSPIMMHAQSVLWYGLLVLLLGRLYRMLDPHPMRNGLATLMFAVGTSHLLTVIWLAARNQLISGCVILICVTFFHQWRQGQGSRYGLLAILTFMIGLASAEAAIAALGYLVAYAAVYEHDKPWWPRLKAIIPYLVIVVMWRIFYSRLGYGSNALGGYIDPGADPVRFLLAMVLRVPTLLTAQLFGVSSSAFSFLVSPLHQMLFAAGATAAVLLCISVAKGLDIWHNHLARFYGLGALLALVPVCAAQPNDRLLLNAEFGLCALLAMLFAQAVTAYRQHKNSLTWSTKATTCVLMLVHLLLYPLATVGLAVAMPILVSVPTHDEPMSLPDAGLHSQEHVILINPPQALFVGYYPVERRYFGAKDTSTIQALASGNQTLVLTVLSDHSFTMSASTGIGDAGRDFHKDPFKVGDKVRAGRFMVTVEEVTAFGMPKVVHFEFDSSLRDKPWRLYAWGESGYVPFHLPGAGQSVKLPKVDLGKLVTKRLKSSIQQG
jgi:hypothetical protein